MHKVFHRVMWKAGKRCRRQRKRPAFEAAAVISALSEAGIASAATVYNSEAPPVAEQASLFRGSGAIGGHEMPGNRNAATVSKSGPGTLSNCTKYPSVPPGGHALQAWEYAPPILFFQKRECAAPGGREKQRRGSMRTLGSNLLGCFRLRSLSGAPRTLRPHLSRFK